MPPSSVFQTAQTPSSTLADSRSGSFDIGDRVVAPVLRLAGVRRLDTLVLTHGDADHVGGAGAPCPIRPHQVWEGFRYRPFEALQRIRAAAQTVGAAWVNVQAADRVAIGDVDLFVRHPGLPDWERQKVRNDASSLNCDGATCRCPYRRHQSGD